MTVTEILEKIKNARKAQGFTQAEMAQKLAITQTQYSNYESGRSEITLRKLLKITEILDLELFASRPFMEDQDFETILKTLGKYR